MRDGESYSLPRTCLDRLRDLKSIRCCPALRQAVSPGHARGDKAAQPCAKATKKPTGQVGQ